jgi:hypothetical protein
MIKCFFVDVKNIESQIPKSKFKKSEIEKLANLILTTDGLLRPLILKQTGVEQYTVIEGNLEYYAAVRAKEKDLNKAEMVNAFVIIDEQQQSAIEQLTLISKTKSITVTTAKDPNLSIDRISSQIKSEISQQLQPLQQQLDTVLTKLDRHKEILASLSKQLESPTDVTDPNKEKEPTVSPDVEIVDERTEPKIELPTAIPIKKPTGKLNSKIKKQQLESQESNSPDVKQAAKLIESKTKEPTPKKSITAKKTESVSTTTKNKVKSDLFASIDPEKLVKTLDLINTLNLTDLTLKMSKSGIGSTAAKLATNIVAIRNTQPERKFDTWEEIVSAKISGLTIATARKVIEKLK